MKDLAGTFPNLFYEVVSRVIPGGVIIAIYFRHWLPNNQSSWLASGAVFAAAWLIGIVLDVIVFSTASAFGYGKPGTRTEIKPTINNLEPYWRNCIIMTFGEATLFRSLCVISTFILLQWIFGCGLPGTQHSVVMLLALPAAIAFGWLWWYHRERGLKELEFAQAPKKLTEEFCPRA